MAPARCREVEKFVEKPDAKTAERYIDEGYLWNSGNFLFRVDVFLAELRGVRARECGKPSPRRSKKATEDLGFILLDKKAFAAAARKSIDYAVMEKTRAPRWCRSPTAGRISARWHGGLGMSERMTPPATPLRGEVVLLDVARFVSSRATKQLTTLLGVKNLVVVAKPTRCWSRPRARRGPARAGGGAAKEGPPASTSAHARVHRPWGTYQILDLGERYQVKRIVVKPGGRLSLQKHHHRAEHWVVVRGTARITIGKKMSTLKENQSIYMPLGSRHRLENPGKIPARTDRGADRQLFR